MEANLAFEQARQKSEYLSNQLTTVQDQLHQNQKTLAVLEKEEIHVDMIAGTSMGAIIGGILIAMYLPMFDIIGKIG